MILTPDAAARRRAGAVAWAATYVVLIVAAFAAIGFAEAGSELLRGALEGVGT